VNTEHEYLRSLIRGMRETYLRGGNVMAFARDHCGDKSGNLVPATLIAYDLQAGSYTDGARANAKEKKLWCEQVADLVEKVLPSGGTILEVGVGEATTLAGVLDALSSKISAAFGFDLSWSRIDEGRRWLSEQGQTANLFVADLFNIPLADGSVDVVYTSHSLEPNSGREMEAIRECLRVAKVALVIIEPIYEFASDEAKCRMLHHGYVSGLRNAAEQLGAEVAEYRLLERIANPLNPSGVLILQKKEFFAKTDFGEKTSSANVWQCPLTGGQLEPLGDLFFNSELGIFYPVVRGVPLLRPEHAVVGSRLDAGFVYDK